MTKVCFIQLLEMNPGGIQLQAIVKIYGYYYYE